MVQLRHVLPCRECRQVALLDVPALLQQQNNRETVATQKQGQSTVRITVHTRCRKGQHRCRTTSVSTVSDCTVPECRHKVNTRRRKTHSASDSIYVRHQRGCGGDPAQLAWPLSIFQFCPIKYALKYALGHALIASVQARQSCLDAGLAGPALAVRLSLYPQLLCGFLRHAAPVPAHPYQLRAMLPPQPLPVGAAHVEEILSKKLSDIYQIVPVPVCVW